MNTKLVSERGTANVLDATRTRIDPALRGMIEAVPSAMRLVAGYHFGWCDRDGRPVDAPRAAGKTLRPALVFLAAAAASETTPVSQADAATVHAAVAVELVHNFSLIHDDVMDRDTLRRHRETVWKVFGVSTAILAGDALLTLAAQALTEIATPVTTTAVTMLHEAVQQLIEGQAADVSFETRADVGLAECAAMASRKTGALMACACALGALLGGASPEQLRHLHTFGMHFGLAFQLADDLLGIWGDPTATGKPSHSDLWTRKKSFPVVAALNSGTDAAAALRDMYRRPEPWNHAEVLRALSLIEEAGGRTWTEHEAARRVEAALSCLDEVRLDRAAAADLAALTRVAAVRDH